MILTAVVKFPAPPFQRYEFGPILPKSSPGYELSNVQVSAPSVKVVTPGVQVPHVGFVVLPVPPPPAVTFQKLITPVPPAPAVPVLTAEYTFAA
jgi:hypothetical protein